MMSAAEVEPAKWPVRDPLLGDQLRRDGYFTTQLISPDVAAQVRARFGELHGWERRSFLDDQPPDFEGDFWNHDLGYRAASAELITAASTPSLERLFRTHRPISGSFLVRWPSSASDANWSDVPNRFHNDAMFIDEPAGVRSYMVWLPVQDVGADNGRLEVVPGSHRVSRGIRGIDFEAPWVFHADVFASRAVPLDLRAGEAVIFDPALIHRSGPNRSPEPRVAASMLLIEPDAPLAFYRRFDADRAERVPVEHDFFATAQFDQLKSMSSDGALVDLPLDDLTPAELAARLDAALSTAGGGRRPWWRVRRTRQR